jgi:hypothetical protein
MFIRKISKIAFLGFLLFGIILSPNAELVKGAKLGNNQKLLQSHKLNTPQSSES